jgi:hypothetical protein
MSDYEIHEIDDKSEKIKTKARMMVQNLLFDEKARTKFQLKPDVVLDEKIDAIEELQKMNPEEKTSLKEQVKSGFMEEYFILPGLNVDEAKNMLLSTINSARHTYSMYKWLNIALFIVGIGLFITAAISGLVTGEEKFSIIFGAGGVLALLPMFLTNPLKRISNSASDLSQIRIVIMGYWAQLNNLYEQVKKQRGKTDFTMLKNLNEEYQKAITHATQTLQANAEVTVTDTNQDYEKEIKALTERIVALEKK